jgi:protein-tyrosine phosphatase
MDHTTRLKRLVKILKRNREPVDPTVMLFHELVDKAIGHDDDEGDLIPPPPFGGTVVTDPQSPVTIILGGVSEAMYPQALRDRNVVAIINAAGLQCRDFQRMEKVMASDQTHVVSQWEKIEFSERWYKHELGNPQFRYLSIDAEDHPRYPIGEHFLQSINFINDVVAAEGSKPTILVHCIQGMNRSAAIVAAYLLATCLGKSLDTIIDDLSRTRRNILTNRNFLTELLDFEDQLFHPVVEQDLSPPPPPTHVFSIGNIVERNV